MVSEQKNSSPPSTHNFSSSFSNRIFSDVAGDITIVVDKESFLLHKFPLVARSGKIRKLVADSKNTSNLVLKNFPGGPESFELAAKFCYGMNFEITASNAAPLRCASHYLEMTEDHREEENLIQRTEAYLVKVAFQSLEKSVEVLSTCEALLPLADVIKIPERCIDSIVKIACREQLVSGLSRLDFNDGSLRVSRDPCLEWWVEDLSTLGIDFYRRVLVSMTQSGVRTDSIIASLIHYAQTSLKGIGKPHIMNPARTNNGGSLSAENGQKTIVESLVSLLPAEKSFSVPLTFMFGMLKIAIMVDASLACRLELERRIASKLENALLDDLLIPSAVRRGDSLFDVDTVHRILVHFLQRIEEEENEEGSGYESEGGIACSGHSSLIRVGNLVDAYLAEIAPDPCLSLAKFVAIIEILPDYARVVDDGLYRAIDIYLKAHPTLTEQECKKLSKFIDCQKLSQEACNHAAQNDRLPVHLVVRVLYSEQLRLKDSMRLNSVDGLLSQKICSGVQSAAMSPRDTYASLRRENRELKLEISRLRVRLSDLEKEQVAMKQGMVMAMEDKSSNARTLLTSISKGFGKFGGKKGKMPEGKKRPAKCKRYSLSLE